MSRDDVETLSRKLEEIQEVFNDRWEKMIQQTSGVASDVKSLRYDFNQHMTEDRAFKEEMRPVLHGKRFFSYFRDFIKYWGIPSGVIVTAVYWIWNKL
jgi:hypothetical protein